MTESLFGHLATRFSKSPENLATEALNFILGYSFIARESLVNFINLSNAGIPTELVFSTQAVGDDASIPDIVGLNSKGNTVLIGESKFWAGLTGNQPVTYIKRLPDGMKAVLLFIAPAKRFFTLWPELLHRCSEAGIIVQKNDSVQEGLISGKINNQHTIALCSWDALLSTIYSQASISGLKNVLEDTHQLMGLCEYMDTDAFLPLRKEELSSNIGLRYLHYHQLVDDVADSLVAKGIASKEGYRATPAYGRYIRYLSAQNYGLGIQFNAEYWSKLRETPLWMSLKEIKDGGWVFPVDAKELLHSLEMEQPSKLIIQNDLFLLPLDVPTGKEKTDVINCLVQQLSDILELLLIDKV